MALAIKYSVATVATVATLAIGIGASVLAFSFVDGTLLSELPYADPDRLMWVSSGALELAFARFENGAWRRGFLCGAP